MPDPTNGMSSAAEAPCVACGHHHGSVNAEINCLRRHVVKYRAIVQEEERFRASVAETRRKWPDKTANCHLMRGKRDG